MRTAIKYALDIAKPFEGLSLSPYYDPVGYPTIGYGHLLSKKKWSDLSNWSAISKEDAEHILMQDMALALNQALSVSPVLAKPINTKRLAAIADFVFNLGIGNYNASTLKRKVDREDWDGAVEQIMRWDKAGGKVLRGLTLRRKAESVLLRRDYYGNG